MARVSVSLFGVFVTVLALGVPVQEAVAAPTPPQDFVMAGGHSEFFHNLSIDAHSDPLGGNASGNVSFVIEVVLRPPFVSPVTLAGPVTCLAVDGNSAVIGFVSFIGPMTAFAVDNGSTGSPDEFRAQVSATDCSSTAAPAGDPLLFGDIVVRDAPSKAQCRDGGWRNYTDAAGQPFKSQGKCIAFALGAA